ncbi:MAG: glycosyltransferase family 9 protein [Pseudomonadota bacterium]
MAEKRLLIIHHGALGDLVVTFPALVRIKKRYDRVDILCQSNLGKMTRALGIVSNWLPLEASSFASLYSDSADSRAKNILQAYHKFVVFSFSSALKTAIQKNTGKTVHLISPRPDVSEQIHVTEHIFAGLTGCGLIEKTDSDRSGIFSRSRDSSRREGRRFDPKKVLIHPGSGSRRKLWHISNFCKIHEKLSSDGFRPEFLFGPAEQFLVRALTAEGNQPKTVHVVDELPELLVLLETAGGFIGNDSGVSHLAAFMGLPTIAVFGPSDPARWKPVGQSVEIVRPDLDCSPCFETDINDCEQKACFGNTSPETVLGAFYRVASDRKE